MIVSSPAPALTVMVGAGGGVAKAAAVTPLRSIVFANRPVAVIVREITSAHSVTWSMPLTWTSPATQVTATLSAAVRVMMKAGASAVITTAALAGAANTADATTAPPSVTSHETSLRRRSRSARVPSIVSLSIISP